MSDESHDYSRVDRFLAARNRAMVLHSVWRPMLAGAAGAALVIAAVWVTLPKISYREIEVPKVTMRDVTVPNIVVKDVTLEIPRIVTHEAAIPRAAAPRSPEEKAFEGSPGWTASVVRGRILREDHNGFVLQTDEGEKLFFPVKIGPDGKAKLDPSLKDVVGPFLGSLAFCRSMPIGVYQCTALTHDGREVAIPEVPIGASL